PRVYILLRLKGFLSLSLYTTVLETVAIIITKDGGFMSHANGAWLFLCHNFKPASRFYSIHFIFLSATGWIRTIVFSVMLTTIAFATRKVCGLDYPFTLTNF